MDWSGAGSQGQQSQPPALPSFPRIWVGYLLGVATLITEVIAVTLHPELAKEPLLIPPLYLFLANFISLVYWMVCVYEFHVILSRVTAGTLSREVAARGLVSSDSVLWVVLGLQVASRAGAVRELCQRR